MPNRSTRAAAAATALVLFLGACGGDAQPGTSEQAEGTANVATATQPPASPSPSSPSSPSPMGVGPDSAAPGDTPPDSGQPTPPPREQEAVNEGAPADSEAPPAPSAPTSDQTAPQANEILVRAERAYGQVRSMEADFVQEVYVPLLDSTQHSRGRIYHRAPDRFAMRFTQPEGDLIVADGRYVWMYYPSTDARQVLRAPLAAGGQQADLYHEFLSDATTRYAATLEGPAQAGGRPAMALTLVPRSPSQYRSVRIWVDDADSLVRRFEITEENGTVRKLEMSNLRPNTNLADSLFEFTPPPGVQVHEF